VPVWLLAAWWGLVGGAALVLGAAVGYVGRVPQRMVAGVMAFGAGVLVSALAFELVDEAYERGGFTPVAIGLLGGALVYSLANAALSRRGAKHRKRSGDQQPSEAQHEGSGLAIAVGALLDGIPESIAIGVSLLQGGAVSWVTVAAVFLSNVPEGLSSASGMKRAGRSPAYVFGIWTGIALLSSVAACIGAVAFRHVSSTVIAATVATAAGAILAMLADTMIPEAFADAHEWSGFITVVGFLTAYLLSRGAGHG
jgi:ZIP family zinc transporter